MGFTQANKININRCNGCAEHCRLGTKPHINPGATMSRFFPTIDGEIITEYTDRSDILIKVCPEAYRKTALDLAHRIARLCDNYKTH